MHIINRKIKKEILKSTVSFHEKQDIDCQFSPLFDLLFIGYDWSFSSDVDSQIRSLGVCRQGRTHILVLWW